MFKAISKKSHLFSPVVVCRRYIDIEGTPFKSRFVREVIFKTKADELPEYVFAKKNRPVRVYTAGSTEEGALAIKDPCKKNKRPGTLLHRDIPVRVAFSHLHKVKKVCCGHGFSVFIVADDNKSSLYGCGLANDCQIGLHTFKCRKLNSIEYPGPIIFDATNKSKAKMVACGAAHTVLVTTDGVLTFGNNSVGQCGRKIVPDEDYSVRPFFHKIEGLNLMNVSSVACGPATSFVVSEGKVHSCGSNFNGECGLGTHDPVDEFTVVEGDLKYEHVTKVAGASDIRLALTDKGDLFGWGNEEFRPFEMVRGSADFTVPVHLPVKFNRKIIDIAATESACLILTDEGEVWTWGQRHLGRGPANQFSPIPGKIPLTMFGCNTLSPDVRINSIHAGMNMAAAITNKNELYTWGDNMMRSCALGVKHRVSYPLMVVHGGNVKSVSLGLNHMAMTVTEL